MMEISKIKNILEAVLLAAERALSVIQLEALFEHDEERPSRDEIRQALHEMAEDYEGRGYQLKQVASGFRLQVRQEYAPWVGRLWEEKPARYTRALLETMALIAYRQPITRGEIEEVRGVSVSSNIIKTLLERDWIKVLGHKDVPGKPALYGTTKEFLDYFNLKSLDQLPTLAEIKDLDSIHPELELDENAQEISDEGQADENQSDARQTADTSSAGLASNDADMHEAEIHDPEDPAEAEVEADQMIDDDVVLETVDDEVSDERAAGEEAMTEEETMTEDDDEERSASNV
jgi:segregation and condensation protein B